MDNLSGKNDKLLVRINKLKNVVDELCAENCKPESEDEIMVVSHYLDQLIAEYMHNSRED